MNQDDFRRLLASGGGATRDSGRKGGGDRITRLDADGIRKLSAKKSSKKSSKPHRSGRQDDSEMEVEATPSSMSQYRDRAAERRQGINVDMHSADDIAHLTIAQDPHHGATVAAPQPSKGLDLSLLRQLKQEKARLQEATAAARQKASVSSSAVDYSELDLAKEPTFQTRLGRMVYFYALQHHPFSPISTPTKSEAFLAGRTHYTFKLGKSSGIPLAVQRSKEDCPDPDDVVSGMVDDLVISDIARVLEAKRAQKKAKHHANETESKDDTKGIPPASVVEQSKTTAPAADDGEEDIFADVGEYVPAYLRQDGSSSSADAANHASRPAYFSNLSASITAAEEAERRKQQEAEEAWKATLEKAAAAQAKLEKEMEAKARAAKLLAAKGAYGEEYLDDGLDNDSDDDSASAGRKKKRKDGDATEEITSDEMDRRKKQKHSNKLQNDLKKINQLMESKSG